MNFAHEDRTAPTTAIGYLNVFKLTRSSLGAKPFPFAARPAFQKAACVSLLLCLTRTTPLMLAVLSKWVSVLLTASSPEQERLFAFGCVEVQWISCLLPFLPSCGICLVFTWEILSGFCSFCHKDVWQPVIPAIMPGAGCPKISDSARRVRIEQTREILVKDRDQNGNLLTRKCAYMATHLAKPNR